jgi:hypothetical protein
MGFADQTDSGELGRDVLYEGGRAGVGVSDAHPDPVCGGRGGPLCHRHALAVAGRALRDDHGFGAVEAPHQPRP